jgi:hypothetical protein
MLTLNALKINILIALLRPPRYYESQVSVGVLLGICLFFPGGGYFPEGALGGFAVALTDTGIRKAKVGPSAYRMTDGGGLYRIDS